MKASFSIMAHPSRIEHATELQRILTAQCEQFVPMALDDGRGIIANCKSAWLMAGLWQPVADVHFVIQDDAKLCKNFVREVEWMVIGNPEHRAYSLYMGRKARIAGTQANALKNGYFIGQLNWGVAVGLRRTLIPRMLAHYDSQEIQKDDARIKRFLIAKTIPVYFPVPSLVDHLPGESLVGDPGTGRVAYKFIDDV